LRITSSPVGKKRELQTLHFDVLKLTLKECFDVVYDCLQILTHRCEYTYESASVNLPVEKRLYSESKKKRHG
jgi:hypothetical protein